MKVRKILIIGCGGHARALADILLDQPRRYVLLGFIDEDESAWGTSIYGLPVLGGDGLLEEYTPPGEISLVNGIGSTRDTARRREIFELFKGAGFSFSGVISGFSHISSRAALGEGVQLMPGAAVQGGCEIGDDVIINSMASVNHDCVIGAHSHIAPGVTLSGSVEIGGGTHIGSGATIIQGVRIGERCLVAAGAVVVSDVPPGGCVAGIPAKSMTNCHTITGFDGEGKTIIGGK
ncbi:MAG: acetyltransferase [Synergistaceae bacterium]|jgi:UDP-perosamine 4-acetyltransferase|nr:acetyltransferase [Synergistaceae bacterium]